MKLSPRTLHSGILRRPIAATSRAEPENPARNRRRANRKKGEIVVRILTPTENKRLNELIGFVGLSLAILLALSLLSYSPRDASFNVAAPPPGAGPARNWIGPVGAHLADLFFQICGFAAFLFPVGMFLVAMKWFRSQLLDAPIAKSIVLGLPLAFAMLMASRSVTNPPPDVSEAVLTVYVDGTVRDSNTSS